MDDQVYIPITKSLINKSLQPHMAPVGTQEEHYNLTVQASSVFVGD